MQRCLFAFYFEISPRSWLLAVILAACGILVTGFWFGDALTGQSLREPLVFSQKIGRRALTMDPVPIYSDASPADR
jgi:hypothetical protein